jgi:hypothetical protein
VVAALIYHAEAQAAECAARSMAGWTCSGSGVAVSCRSALACTGEATIDGRAQGRQIRPAVPSRGRTRAAIS